MKKIRWGILGAAKIARTKVIPAMQRAQEGEGDGPGLALAETGARGPRPPSDPEGLRLLRGAARRPRRGRGLQPAPEPPARAVVYQGGGGGQTRALREADRVERGGGAGPSSRYATAPAYLIQEALHGAPAPAMAGRARRGARGDGWASCARSRCAFSYFNRDPQNVRNQAGIGGGALMDIGCLSHRALALPVRKRSPCA